MSDHLPNDCRAAFEKWWRGVPVELGYNTPLGNACWDAWQVAWNTRVHPTPDLDVLANKLWAARTRCKDYNHVSYDKAIVIIRQYYGSLGGYSEKSLQADKLAQSEIPVVTPPVDNAFVKEGCELFDMVDERAFQDAEAWYRKLTSMLHDADLRKKYLEAYEAAKAMRGAKPVSVDAVIANYTKFTENSLIRSTVKAVLDAAEVKWK